ncbi:hypothetical protein K1719_039347 [Acacia pycnantha]|nr:hypothetical protein K1719_039347 [Acacia pycnantha]
MDTLLALDPAEQKTASDALISEFFTTEPYACDPSSLPKYPPSKEMDAKRRDDEVEYPPFYSDDPMSTCRKAHPFFRGVEWDKLYQMEAAFIPKVNDELDTQNFEKFQEADIQNQQASD